MSNQINQREEDKKRLFGKTPDTQPEPIQEEEAGAAAADPERYPVTLEESLDYFKDPENTMLFIDELKTMVSELVVSVMSDNSSHIDVPQQPAERPSQTAPDEKPKRRKRVTRFEDIECPVCHQGHLVKGRTGYGCSRYREGCTTIYPFADYPDTLTPAKLAALLRKKNNTKQ